MRLIRDNNPFVHHSVVTLGNYDGIHLGHQELLNRLKKMSEQLKLPSVVIIFEPSPKEFFSKKKITPRLMGFREKWAAFKAHAIDYLLCIRFNESFSKLSPEDFVKNILINQLGTKAVVIGDDFRFGAKRAGNSMLLKALGKQYGFELIQQNTVTIENERISSTRIREALQSGNLSLANLLLGRPYRLSGKIIHGDKRGRQLGFPTANLNTHQRLLPLSGIFVVRVFGLDKKIHHGVASVGTRPMFKGSHHSLEVHLFDFNQDIYGRFVEVEFLHKLRDEHHYTSIEALVKQMHQDVQEAKAYFLNALSL